VLLGHPNNGLGFFSYRFAYKGSDTA